jgi:hypothetical protein
MELHRIVMRSHSNAVLFVSNNENCDAGNFIFVKLLLYFTASAATVLDECVFSFLRVFVTRRRVL